MSAVTLPEVVSRLGWSVNALSALGAALVARAEGRPLPAELAGPVGEVLAALQVEEGIAAASSAQLRPLLGEIRVALLHGVQRLSAGGPGLRWAPTDEALLNAPGDVSAGIPMVLRALLPQIEGLGARLEAPDGAFLDVGVGVAGLAVEMSRAWPRLRVVGLDVWTPSLALGRRNVTAAGLASRIELREQAFEDLPDEQAFDLIWVPSLFIPAPALTEGLRRAVRALRPGGWVLFASAASDADPLTAALARLRTREWGGVPWTPEEARALLAAAGFADVRALGLPPGAPVCLTVGRRAP
jgi:SAM-dependent methyltransferase